MFRKTDSMFLSMDGDAGTSLIQRYSDNLF